MEWNKNKENILKQKVSFVIFLINKRYMFNIAKLIKQKNDYNRVSKNVKMLENDKLIKDFHSNSIIKQISYVKPDAIDQGLWFYEKKKMHFEDNIDSYLHKNILAYNDLYFSYGRVRYHAKYIEKVNSLKIYDIKEYKYNDHVTIKFVCLTTSSDKVNYGGANLFDVKLEDFVYIIKDKSLKGNWKLRREIFNYFTKDMENNPLEWYEFNEKTHFLDITPYNIDINKKLPYNTYKFKNFEEPPYIDESIITIKDVIPDE